MTKKKATKSRRTTASTTGASRKSESRAPERKNTPPADARSAETPAPLYRHAPEPVAFFRSRWKPLLALFLLALVVRLAHFFFIQANDPSFAQVLKGVDTYTYDQWALKILGGDWASSDQRVFFYGPVYPYFLAAVYGALGHHYSVAHLVQLIVGALTTVLVFLGASQWFSRRVAFVGGLGFALCSQVLFYESMLLPATVTFVALAGFVCVMGVVQNREGRGWPLWIVTGLLLGVATLQRGNALLCAGGVAIWVAAYFSSWSWRRRALAFALFLAGLLAAIAPATAHNRVFGNKWVLVTSNGAKLMYIGNAHDATGAFDYPPSFSKLDREAKAANERVDWAKELKKEVLGHPVTWIGLLLKKTYIFWAAHDAPDNFSYDLYKRFSPALKWNPIGFAILAPLGLVGLVLGVRQWRRLMALYLFIIIFCVSIVLVFVVGRYRTPVLVGLSGFVGLSCVQAWAWARARRWPQFGAWIVGVVVLFVLLRLYVVTPFGIRPNDFTMFAHYYNENGQTEKAIALLEEAEECYRDKAPATDVGRRQKTLSLFLVRNTLIKQLVESKQWGRAEDELEGLLRRGEIGQQQLNQLLLVYMRQNKTDAARQLLERLVLQFPDNQQWRDALERLRAAPSGG